MITQETHTASAVDELWDRAISETDRLTPIEQVWHWGHLECLASIQPSGLEAFRPRARFE